METDQILENVREQVAEVLEELVLAAKLGPGSLVVMGTSTSEVIGAAIGKEGAESIAEELYKGIESIRSKYNLRVAFQCCEHLNRALVIERSSLEELRLCEVSAVPVPRAGGSMAAVAYRNLKDPCLVESIEAYAGIDIGETLIGMHLRQVAIPFRPSRRFIGKARVTAAWTRPKLIGGERAIYALPEVQDSHVCL